MFKLEIKLCMHFYLHNYMFLSGESLITQPSNLQYFIITYKPIVPTQCLVLRWYGTSKLVNMCYFNFMCYVHMCGMWLNIVYTYVVIRICFIMLLLGTSDAVPVLSSTSWYCDVTLE